jgi:hypothetical protein
MNIQQLQNTTPSSIVTPSFIKHEKEGFVQLDDKDVIFGRGGLSYNHSGNRLFRRLVEHNRGLFESCKRPAHRNFVALSIVKSVLRSGGRFLRKADNKAGGGWKVVGVKDACLKTIQALRDASIRTKKFKAHKDLSNFISERYSGKMKSRLSLLIQESMSQNIILDNFPKRLQKPEDVAVRQEESLMDGLDVVDLETAETLLDALQEDGIPSTLYITYPSFYSMSEEVSSTSNILGPTQLIRSITDIPDSNQVDPPEAFEDALIQSSLISIPLDDIIEDSPTLIEDFTIDNLNDDSWVEL